MKIKNTNLISIVVVPFLLLFFQTTTAQNVLMTGWGSALTSNSLNQMDSHLSELGYTVSQSDTFPDDIAGYDLIIIMGGGNGADIPETKVDDFVNTGGGLVVFEGAVENYKFDITANSNPVSSYSGWTERTNATVTDPDHVVCTGVPATCGFIGYSTNPVLKANAHAVMKWEDQTVFAAVLKYGAGRVVYINYLQAWYYGYWGSESAEGKQLMENILPWVGKKTRVDKNSAIVSVSDYIISQNYPNPFNPSTSIHYNISQAGQVEIHIYNGIGERLITLVREYQYPGQYEVMWSGETESNGPASSGTYFYQIRIGNYSHTNKMLLLK